MQKKKVSGTYSTRQPYSSAATRIPMRGIVMYPEAKACGRMSHRRNIIPQDFTTRQKARGSIF
jgi:hypothetical protein